MIFNVAHFFVKSTRIYCPRIVLSFSTWNIQNKETATFYPFLYTLSTGILDYTLLSFQYQMRPLPQWFMFARNIFVHRIFLQLSTGKKMRKKWVCHAGFYGKEHAWCCSLKELKEQHTRVHTVHRQIREPHNPSILTHTHIQRTHIWEY